MKEFSSNRIALKIAVVRPENRLCRRARASFSSEILQDREMKGLNVLQSCSLMVKQDGRSSCRKEEKWPQEFDQEELGSVLFKIESMLSEKPISASPLPSEIFRWRKRKKRRRRRRRTGWRVVVDID